MKPRNLIITLLLTALGFTTASAQSLVLRHRDGTASVVRVTDSLRLQTAGTQISVISGADIQKYDNDDILSITFRKGRSDVNRDFKTNISDVVAIINDMANNGKQQQAVPTTDSDVNGDGKTDISDVVAVINVMAGQDHTPLPVVPEEDTNYYSETGSAFYIYRNDGEFNGFLRNDADSISFKNGCQLVHTEDSTFAIPFAAIDSVSFIKKKPVLREGLFFLNEYHAAHITAIDSLTLYFDSGIITDSLPNVGQVVLHGAYMPPFEEGFAGRVKSVNLENNKIKVDCDMICIGDVYKRLILVGNAESVSDEEYAKHRKRSCISGDPWVPFTDGTTPIKTLDDMKFSFFGDLISIESKAPKLQVHYTAYVDEWTYHVTATCRIKHDELIHKIKVSLGDFLGIEDNDKLEKEDKEIAEALKRQYNYQNMEYENWWDSVIEENTQKSEKEKLSNEEATLMKKLWDKCHLSAVIPIYGPIVLDAEFGPLCKLKGGVDLSCSLTSKALNTFYVEARGNTMATMADPRLALSTGLAHIKGYADFHRDPIHKTSFSIGAKGSLSIGLVGKIGLSFIHKSLLHATVSAQTGIKLVGSINVEVNDDNYDEFGWYEALKDTKIKLEPFVSHSLELGVTPWDFLTANFEWESDCDEIGSVYLFPHFTKPAFPEFNADKEQWSNGNSNNHLVLQSKPSKNIPDLIFGPCKIGLRIVDEDGNTVKETKEHEYSFDGMFTWALFPLSIDLSGLEEGKTYRCYPVLRYFAKKMWRATPSFEFTVPKKMSVTSSSVNVDVGNTQTIYLSGGWGIYKILGGSNVASALFDRSYLTKRRSSGLINTAATSEGDSIISNVWADSDKPNNAPRRIGGFSDPAFTDGGGGAGGGSTAWEEIFVNEKDEDGIDFPVHGLPIIIKGLSAGTDTITIEDMRSGLKQTVEIVVGGESNSALTLSTTSLNFGNVQAGESKTMEFTITNNSEEGVTFTIGKTQGEFSIAESGKTFSLFSGGHRTFKVTFSSDQTDQDYTDEIIITNAGDNNTQRIELIATTKEGSNTYLTCPDDNHPHVIDMGVAGKWACCNVGASAPWEYGGYYAWGETEEKSCYNWSTYIHCDGSLATCHDIGDDIAGTQYDVAHVKWGGSWHMPSYEHFRILIDNSSSEKTSINGVDGILIKGTNGSTLFFPCSGRREGYKTYIGNSGEYWSSSRSEYRPDYSALNFSVVYSLVTGESHTEFEDGNGRDEGYSVRAVTE